MICEIAINGDLPTYIASIMDTEGLPPLPPLRFFGILDFPDGPEMAPYGSEIARGSFKTTFKTTYISFTRHCEIFCFGNLYFGDL